MKRTIIFTMLCSLLWGCGYSEQEREQLYNICKKQIYAENVISKIAAEIACKNWAARKDIKPKKMQEQFNEEYKKVWFNPVQLSYGQRGLFIKDCINRFTTTGLSEADIYQMAGVPTETIAIIGWVNPNTFKRPNNSDKVECACRKVVFDENFRLAGWEDNFNKFLNECK